MNAAKRFKITYRTTFSPLKPTKVSIWLASPQNSGLQKIHNFHTSQKKDAKYSDKENEILYFLMDAKKPTTLEFSFDTTLRQGANDPTHAPLNAPNIKNYLQEEPFLEQIAWVKETTHNLTRYDKISRRAGSCYF
jgi:hypothetical protein